VLSGNGASLLYSLLTKSKPVNIAAGIPVVLQDFDAQFKLAGGEYHPVLSLMQQWVDVADPLNHAAAIARRAPTGRTPKHVFQTYGLGDTFSTPITMATYAAALGGVQVRPDASVTTPDTIEGVPVSAAVPVSGNLSIGGRSYTLAVRQYTPPSGRDGHFVAFDVANANADVARFLGMASRGTVPAAGN
jgi:hypothetical protein